MSCAGANPACNSSNFSWWQCRVSTRYVGRAMEARTAVSESVSPTRTFSRPGERLGMGAWKGETPSVGSMARRLSEQARLSARSWPAWGLTVVVLIGVWFRLYHLDYKVYWADEVYSSLRIVGLTEGELVRRAAGLATMSDLSKLVRPTAEQRRPVTETIASLASEDPQHPPLYYVAAHFWTKYAGTSIAAMRSLSVAIGLLMLPLMYWLCKELFRSQRSAWLGTSLIAVSPIFVLYSQENREYILWAAATVWMSASLLRAMSLESVNAWALYALSFTVGLYTYPLTLLVALGHGIYVLAVTGFRPTRSLAAFIASAFTALVLFSPWLYVLYQHQQQIGAALTPSAKTGMQVLSERTSAFHALRRFLGQLRLAFIDLDPLRTAGLQVAGAVAVLGLIAYSLYCICKLTCSRSWKFVLALMFSTSVPILLLNLTLPDRTSVPRYYMPLYVAIVLSVAGCLASELDAARSASRRAFWNLAATLIFFSCIVSLALSARAETWWNKLNDESKTVARVISRSPHALIISDNRIVHSAVLSYYLGENTAVMLRPRCYLCDAEDPGFTRNDLVSAERFRNVFLFGPSQELKRAIQAAPIEGAAVHCVGVNANLECAGNLWILPPGW